jgi:hypothetical protein
LKSILSRYPNEGSEMSPAQLYPEVIDATTVGAVQVEDVPFPIGIEGGIDTAGTAVEKELHLISRASEASGFFGPNASLTKLVSYLLDRGSGPVWAIPSKKTSAPALADRQAAWQTLENRREIRIRLTDSVVQADHVALGVSCNNASLLNNKQFAIVGMPAATSKALLITAATAINSSRVVLVAPSVYDDSGVLQTGAYAAASVAAMRAQNGDVSDDMDTATVPRLSAIERDTLGNDLFRQLVVSGTAVNDFEDLLQGGVSPLMTGLDGGVAITHLRMTATAQGTWDALQTRMAADEIFVMIRDYAYRYNALRKGNTPTTRAQLQSGVDALLRSQGDIILPVVMGDGTRGYNVQVSASADNRQQIVSYQGQVVRGTQTILIQGNLVIPA